MRTSPANVGEGDDVKSKSLQPKLMINLTEEEVWSGPGARQIVDGQKGLRTIGGLRPVL